MSEYPKRCTMEEAIACVKAGGKAGLKGTLETEWTKIRRTASGSVFVRWFPDEPREFSGTFEEEWNYQITKPAPAADQSTTRTYTTAEAVTEVLRSGEEMVGSRNGTIFTLNLDLDKDIVCTGDSDAVPWYIPVSRITWTKRARSKSKTVTKSFDFDLETDAALTIGSRILDATRGLRSKITVECTIKERS